MTMKLFFSSCCIMEDHFLVVTRIPEIYMYIFFYFWFKLNQDVMALKA